MILNRDLIITKTNKIKLTFRSLKKERNKLFVLFILVKFSAFSVC